MHVEPFAVAIPDTVLDDLRARIRRTRWPEPAPGRAVEPGHGPGLPARSAGLLGRRVRLAGAGAGNQPLQHRIADVDGEPVHFVHHRVPGGGRAR